jgi:uncharacterized repeat protein (TIGR02543 family)
MTKHLPIQRFLATLLTIAALFAGRQAFAETVTYTISGNTDGQGNVELIVTASGSVTGTASTTWAYSTATSASVSLPGGITLSFGSDHTGSMAVQSGILQIQANSNTGGYITLSHSTKYIYHVTLTTNTGNIEAWNKSTSYTYRFHQIGVTTIVVEYADKIPFNDAVLSGIEDSYYVSNTPVKPYPTVTWHGTILDRTDHYDLTWTNNNTAGTATVTATGVRAFTGSVSTNYTLNWAIYTIHFDANGGSGVMSDQSFYYTEQKTLTANSFSRAGYSFDEWNTAADGTGTAYTDQQSVSNLTAIHGATIDLYVQWTPITYNITYDLDGGSVATANPTTYNVETETFTLNNPTKEGYTFTGWTGSNGNTPETTLTIAQGSTDDRSYTANWTPNYTITYNLDGGSVATANPTTYSAMTPTFTLNNPTKEGYTFTGWTGSNGSTPETTVTIDQGSIGDRNYTANWVPYAFTLSLGTNITASGIVAFILDGANYYAPGTEISLTYSGTIPEGQYLVFEVNGVPISGDNFVMPAQNVEVTAVIQGQPYIFNSTTGALTLVWGEFNKSNKWGDEVIASAVTSVTATNQVSFTGDCTSLFKNFTECTSMNLGDVNTDSLTNMNSMFLFCSSLTTLDLSGWNTGKVTSMSSLFAGCESLTSLDLTGWNTAKVTAMYSLFNGCTSLQSLDLSSWNTGRVRSMYLMFDGCTSLTTIYVGEGWSTEEVNSSDNMFRECDILKGGMGTAPQHNKINKEYARIDMPDAPGYFTGRFNKAITGYQNDESGWYLIASPLAANVAPTAVTNMTNETFDLYRFNQSSTNGLEWENFKATTEENHPDFTTLVNGQGYLYANSGDVTLSFTGTPYNDNGQVTLTKTSGAEFEGWNLVGNPFTVNAYILDGRSFYIMNDQGSEIIAASEVDRDYIEPMEGIFVEATTDNETMTFTTTKPTNSPSPALVINVNQTVTNRGGGLRQAQGPLSSTAPSSASTKAVSCLNCKSLRTAQNSISRRAARTTPSPALVETVCTPSLQCQSISRPRKTANTRLRSIPKA